MVARLTFITVLAACGFTSVAEPLSDDPAAGDAGGPGPGSGSGNPGPADRDGDGVLDVSDNCPDVANAAQYDEDGDRRGDACDNCPHLVNAAQDNADGDEVGDACDPRPGMEDHLVLFLGFNLASDLAGWSQAGSGSTFTVADGAVSQVGNTDLGFLWRNDLSVRNLSARNAWITTRVRMNQLSPSMQIETRGAAVFGSWARGPADFGNGSGCGELTDTMYNGNRPFYASIDVRMSRYLPVAETTGGQPVNGASVAADRSATYTVHVVGDQVSCRVDDHRFDERLSMHMGTGVNLAVWGATASFQYLVVID